jgi:type 1 glutamine amidotransferase
MKAYVLSGGAYHDFAETTGLLKQYAAPCFEQIDICDELARFGQQPLEPYDLVILNSLYYSGNGGAIGELAKQNLTRYVENGGSLLVMHSSLGNWDNWSEYITIAGGLWDWNRSTHDPFGEMTVKVVPGHPLTDGVSPVFRIRDEKYERLTLLDSIQVLAYAVDERGTYPHLWITPHAQGRLVTIALGHSSESWSHPDFARLFQNAIRYLTSK